MEIQSVKLVYFSPTGTTKAVLHGIARGINPANIELIDITLPHARKKTLTISENDLVIVGVPVYMGRVPALITDWLNSIKAANTPAVCVVVYGNRIYDNALLELKNILTERGCLPIAGAAYIGEHSFSSLDTPIAESRPDHSDLNNAELFGRRIKEKLLSVSSVDQISEISIPGEYPYGGATKLWDVDFIEISDDCKNCGICAEVCPAGAIDPGNNLIDIVKCITCCACIKNCPQKARIIKPSKVKDAAVKLNEFCYERKEPEFFL